MQLIQRFFEKRETLVQVQKKEFQKKFSLLNPSTCPCKEKRKRKLKCLKNGEIVVMRKAQGYAYITINHPNLLLPQ